MSFPRIFISAGEPDPRKSHHGSYQQSIDNVTEHMGHGNLQPYASELCQRMVFGDCYYRCESESDTVSESFHPAERNCDLE